MGRRSKRFAYGRYPDRIYREKLHNEISRINFGDLFLNIFVDIPVSEVSTK